MVLVNGVKFNDAEFHNGEIIFEKPENVSLTRNIIQVFFQDNRDITALMFAKQYLDDVCLRVPCDLEIKYCPYERMDREINNQMFSMKYFAEIISKFNFDTVYILDPHSGVCIEQFEKAGVNVQVLDLERYVNKVIEDFKPDYICYPDKGARTKYSKVLRDIEIPYFYGSKKRDLANQGRIMEYELVDAPDLKDKKVLIIDDICCLGGTAYNAAVEMKRLGAKEVAFYISHCENGIFAGKILHPEPFYPDGSGVNLPWAGKYTIDKVYTADTMKLNNEHKNIIIVN